MKKQYWLSPVLSILLVFVAQLSFAAETPADFRHLVKSAGAAVVNISTERTVKRSPMLPPGFEMFRGHPDMERFFEQFDEFNSQSPKGMEGKRTSLGSGFVITEDGYIVTNNHVIDGADTIKITFDEKKTEEHIAEVVGTDPETDLALLKIEASNLPFLAFGNSDNLEVGEWLLAIGNPLGLDHTVTAGILSAKGRKIQSGSYDDFLQTDASINPGNSGGPLLNMAGEVVGINTAIAQRAQGIGFAIPSSMAQKIIGSLKEHRKVSRGWLGVTIQNVDAATAKVLKLDEAKGALISNVIEGQPADKAGLKPGDIIIAIDGTNIADTDQLLRIVALLVPGKESSIDVWRDGKKLTMSLTVAEKAPQMQAAVETPKGTEQSDQTLGLKLRPITKEDVARAKLNVNQGLVVMAVENGGLASAAGLQPADIIVSINRKEVTKVEELNEIVGAARKNNGAILLLISRKNNMFFRAIELSSKE